MDIKYNVSSTKRPEEVEYNDKYVYVNSDIREVEELGMTMYYYTVTKYEKDEFIVMMSKQLNGLSFRVDDGILVIITPD